jgi:ankyrin repeat protein
MVDKSTSEVDWELLMSTIDKSRKKEFKPRNKKLVTALNRIEWNFLMKYLLHSSAIDVKVVKELLEAGCSAKQKSSVGNTPLLVAMSNSSITPQIVQTLVDAGADPLERFKCGQDAYQEFLIQNLNNVRNEELFLQMLYKFLSFGIDLNKPNQEHNTVFTFALRRKPVSRQHLSILLLNGADINLATVKAHQGSTVNYYTRRHYLNY